MTLRIGSCVCAVRLTRRRSCHVRLFSGIGMAIHLTQAIVKHFSICLGRRWGKEFEDRSPVTNPWSVEDCIQGCCEDQWGIQGEGSGGLAPRVSQQTRWGFLPIV